MRNGFGYTQAFWASATRLATVRVVAFGGAEAHVGDLAPCRQRTLQSSGRHRIIRPSPVGLTLMVGHRHLNRRTVRQLTL